MRRKNDENVLINEEKIYRENKESKQTIKYLKIKRERFNYVLSFEYLYIETFRMLFCFIMAYNI